MHHRHHIVCVHVSLNELTRGTSDDLGSRRGRVEVVEHEHIQPAGKRAFARLNVGFDDRGTLYGCLLNRYIDKRKARNLLPLAVFEDLEIFGSQVPDELTLRIGDERIHLHVFDFCFECGCRRDLRRILARGNSVGRNFSCAVDTDETQRNREEEAWFHVDGLSAKLPADAR
jgi:hypothetical protein